MIMQLVSLAILLLLTPLAVLGLFECKPDFAASRESRPSPNPALQRLLPVAYATHDHHMLLSMFQHSMEVAGIPVAILGMGKLRNQSKILKSSSKNIGTPTILKRKWDTLLKFLEHASLSWRSEFGTSAGATTIGPYDLLLFNDAFDVLNNGCGAQQILLRFRELGCDVVFSAEKTCWRSDVLNESGLCDLFEKHASSGTALPYPNAGFMLGTAHVVLDLLRRLPEEMARWKDDIALPAVWASETLRNGATQGATKKH